jgi:hypothetical protein
MEFSWSYGPIAGAFGVDGPYRQAVQVGDKAVAVARLGFDDGSGSSAAYYIRGQAKALRHSWSSAMYCWVTLSSGVVTLAVTVTSWQNMPPEHPTMIRAMERMLAFIGRF